MILDIMFGIVGAILVLWLLGMIAVIILNFVSEW